MGSERVVTYSTGPKSQQFTNGIPTALFNRIQAVEVEIKQAREMTEDVRVKAYGTEGPALLHEMLQLLKKEADQVAPKFVYDVYSVSIVTDYELSDEEFDAIVAKERERFSYPIR